MLRIRIWLYWSLKNLTVDPEAMTRTGVESLLQAGFSDIEILDLVHVAAFFNYLNRVDEALGLTRWLSVLSFDMTTSSELPDMENVVNCRMIFEPYFGRRHIIAGFRLD